MLTNLFFYAFKFFPRPENMLIPKGTEEGLQCEIFIMVSNNDNDKVQVDDSVMLSCKNSASYCGIRNQLYPDLRAMGFPFDRLSREPNDNKPNNLNSFLTTNMKVQDVSIVFNEMASKVEADGSEINENSIPDDK